MDDKEKRIAELEDRNSELAKEILLNESAVYEAETEIENLDTDLIGHPRIQQYVNQLNLLVKRLKQRTIATRRRFFRMNWKLKN